jgi:hypothetical protein
MVPYYIRYLFHHIIQASLGISDFSDGLPEMGRSTYASYLLTSLLIPYVDLGGGSPPSEALGVGRIRGHGEVYILGTAPCHFDVAIKALEAGIRLQGTHDKFPLLHVEPLEMSSQCIFQQIPRGKKAKGPRTTVSVQMRSIAEIFERVGEVSSKAG